MYRIYFNGNEFVGETSNYDFAFKLCRKYARNKTRYVELYCDGRLVSYWN